MTGKGYVTGFDTGTDSVKFNIASNTTKLYDLSIRVAAIYGEKRASVVLNGGASSEVYFAANQSWASVSGGQLLLNQGTNTVEIVNNWGWCVTRRFALTGGG